MTFLLKNPGEKVSYALISTLDTAGLAVVQEIVIPEPSYLLGMQAGVEMAGVGGLAPPLPQPPGGGFVSHIQDLLQSVFV